jgi:hypothetical protein
VLLGCRASYLWTIAALTLGALACTDPRNEPSATENPTADAAAPVSPVRAPPRLDAAAAASPDTAPIDMASAAGATPAARPDAALDRSATPAPDAAPAICDVDQLMCLGDGRVLGCARKRWDFEDGANPWGLGSDGTDDQAARGVSVSAARAHLGNKAVRVDIDVRPGHYRMLLDGTAHSEALCPVGAIGLLGRTVSLQILIDSPVMSAARDYCRISGYVGARPGQLGVEGERVFVTVGQWTRLDLRVDDPSVPPVNALAVDCIFMSASPWTGAVYLDDFTVE